MQFSFDGITPSQNELDGKHWRVKHTYRTYWHSIVAKTAGRNRKPVGFANVTITRVSNRMIDPLNIYAGMKWLLDALVENGWLRGDSYKDLRIYGEQRKCEKNEQKHMEVVIEYC